MATQVICDHCGQRIERMPFRLTGPAPAFEAASHDFCGLQCVSAWIADAPNRLEATRKRVFERPSGPQILGYLT